MLYDKKIITSENFSPLKLLVFFIDGLMKLGGGLISFLNDVAAWIDLLYMFR